MEEAGDDSTLVCYFDEGVEGAVDVLICHLLLALVVLGGFGTPLDER